MNPTALKAGQVLPMVRSLGRLPDPIDLFARLTDQGRREDTLLLESGDTSASSGEKSLLAVRSCLKMRCYGSQVEVWALNHNGRNLLSWLLTRLTKNIVSHNTQKLLLEYPPTHASDEQTRLLAEGPVDVLRTVATGPQLVTPNPQALGLVAGVFGYDLLDHYEDLGPKKPDPLGWPDYEFWLPDQMIWLHHRMGTATAVLHVHGGPLATEVYHDATAAITRIVEQAQHSVDQTGAARKSYPQQSSSSSQQPQAHLDQNDQQFAQTVEKLKQHIIQGDVFQIVLSRTFSLPCPDSLDAYQNLRNLNPSPYMFYINSQSGILFGASPETAIKVSGKPARIEIRPIAGTRQRARNADGQLDHDLDSRIEADMRLDPKEIAEHMMLVDLARNDVARVCVPHTRKVDRLLGVERYSHVMHLVSTVSGQLRPEVDALSAYVATMNMGTLIGAPKIKAARLLRKYEPSKRGTYGGAVGYLDAAGHLDTAIVIRSAIVKQGVAHIRAGAGIVFDSDPHSEAEETKRKAAAVLDAVKASTSLNHPQVTNQKKTLHILFIDNFDSFSFNLVSAFREAGCRVEVYRNDLPAQQAMALAQSLPSPKMIVLSPGPGIPQEAGCLLKLVHLASGRIPVFGVCLGHQAIAQALGGTVGPAPQVVHGKSVYVKHCGQGIFQDLPSGLLVGRYHSLVALELGEHLRCTARYQNLVMAFEHKHKPLVGVQFHPESILTPMGNRLIKNIVAWAIEQNTKQTSHDVGCSQKEFAKHA